MEHRHQPGPGLRACRLGQPTAWQTCFRNFPTVATPTLPHNSTVLNVPAYRDPVKRCNFHKADWKRFCFLIIKSVERLPPSDTTNIKKAYQEICVSPLSAAKQCITLSRGKNYVPCWDKECEILYRSFLRTTMGTDSDRAASSILHDWTIRSRSDGKKLSIPSISRTPAARRAAPSTNWKNDLYPLPFSSLPWSKTTWIKE